MDNHDGMIKRDDVKAVRRQIHEKGWGDFALEIFEHEPLLGQVVSSRWANIRMMLTGLGMAEDDIQPIMRQVTTLAIEIVGLQERAKNKLMVDLLPDMNNDGGDHA